MTNDNRNDMVQAYYNEGDACEYGPIAFWDTTAVTNMYYMFGEVNYGSAQSFNGDIAAWDVSGVTTMKYSFSNCASFNANIAAW